MPVQLRHRQRSFPRSSRTTARYEPDARRHRHRRQPSRKVAAVREAISACLASLCFLPNCCALKLHPLSRRCGPLSAACSIASRRLMCLGGGPRTAGADGRLTVCAGTTRGLKLPIKGGNSDEKASAIPLRTERYFAYTNNLVISGYSISAITPMAEYHEPSGFQR